MAANNPKAEIHRSARGTDIETQIPFRLFTSHRPREGFLSATGATYLLYGLMAVLWLYLLVEGRAPQGRDAPTIVEQTLADSTRLSSHPGSRWSLQQMTWDSKMSAYSLSLVEAGTGNKMIVDVEAETGKYLKVSNTP